MKDENSSKSVLPRRICWMMLDPPDPLLYLLPYPSVSHLTYSTKNERKSTYVQTNTTRYFFIGLHFGSKTSFPLFLFKPFKLTKNIARKVSLQSKIISTLA